MVKSSRIRHTGALSTEFETNHRLSSLSHEGIFETQTFGGQMPTE